MKLPVIDSFAFSVILPSTKEPISIRPFLVKEEKLLLMSQESNNAEMQMDAVAQIIKNCTFNAIDPKTAPFFDIEYLLLQIRSKSVGEIIKPTYKCRNFSEDTQSECGHLTSVSINLAEIPPTNISKDPSSFLLKINERYTLKLRYPTIFTVNELLSAALQKGVPTAEKTINAIVDLFDVLIDNINQNTYNFDDYNKEEKINFLDRLTPQDYGFIVNFLEDMPTVSFSNSYTCAQCGTTHAINLEGLSDFLA